MKPLFKVSLCGFQLNHALEDIEEQQSLLDTVNKKSLQYSKDISELKSRLEEQKMQNEDLDEKQKKLAYFDGLHMKEFCCFLHNKA